MSCELSVTPGPRRTITLKVFNLLKSKILLVGFPDIILFYFLKTYLFFKI